MWFDREVMSLFNLNLSDRFAGLRPRQAQEPLKAEWPTWKIAWNAAASWPEPPVWQDGPVAVFASAADLPLAVSPSGRFVVIGDLWLSQRLEPDLQAELSSDLQWVSTLWEQQGPDTWQQLVGMFALAVWDRERQTLSMGRDRVGAYTLYYTPTGSTGWIAPQLRLLRPHHDSALDPIALRDYLCCGFVPGERTMWQNVRELRPGTVLHLPDQTITTYWVLQEQIERADQPLTWHSTRLRSLLEQTVQATLPVGEPVGCFLSGGIDSSCVTALAGRLHDAPVHSFSIHFGADYPNELEFSSLVAQHCRTQHHILEISLTELWRQLPEALKDLDDPIGDPLTVPNLLLGRLAKQFVNVVLNGEGGDPCFGGPKNQPMLIHSLYDAVSQQTILQAYLTSFQKCAADLHQLIQPEVWQRLQSEPSIFEDYLCPESSEMNYLNRLMAINIQFKGADHILTKVNNLMRAAGLQGRSPLFDPRMVELSMQIPPQYKLSGVQEKAVLKQAVADLLPDAIIHRPKSGMMVPVQIGFQQHWQREARALLLNRRAAIAPYLNQALIRDWLNYRGDTWRRYGVKLWQLTSLEIWLQVNRL